MIKYKDTEYQCSMELTLDIIGGKWKPIILWYLSSSTLRFGELKKKMPKITQKMLTQQLKSLEENELINRVVYNEIPPKVEYSLTDKGKTLVPILAGLSEWAHEYINSNKAY
ncbi:winged helix-turn-helix transcriptional regulator [Clostridium hydrogenum]|uniref:winged helix-turn-helix transcriptional regulator n=1 Tax=Clostridium hydrogenum TaxID=2855764 RepID=UPI001F3BAECC|nr:helix-turn-helix domain-containing protein [Clostridium hydrogenum]